MFTDQLLKNIAFRCTINVDKQPILNVTNNEMNLFQNRYYLYSHDLLQNVLEIEFFRYENSYNLKYTKGVGITFNIVTLSKLSQQINLFLASLLFLEKRRSIYDLSKEKKYIISNVPSEIPGQPYEIEERSVVVLNEDGLDYGHGIVFNDYFEILKDCDFFEIKSVLKKTDVEGRLWRDYDILREEITRSQFKQPYSTNVDYIISAMDILATLLRQRR